MSLSNRIKVAFADTFWVYYKGLHDRPLSITEEQSRERYRLELRFLSGEETYDLLEDLTLLYQAMVQSRMRSKTAANIDPENSK